MALATSRYTLPGVYIAQLLRPRPGNLTADARLCNYIGRGSRLARVDNAGIRRSFVFDEELSFPINAPFLTFLNHISDGVKASPTVVVDSITGVELRQDQWSFLKSGSDFDQVLIAPDAYDPTAVYKISYQSLDRDIQDPLPIDDLRAIKSVGNSPDRAQYTDFVDFYIPFEYSGPTINTGNAITTPFLTSVFADGGNLGAGTVSIDGAASYNHNYNRFYELTVIATSGSVGTLNATATFEWSARVYSGGNENLPPTPLHTTMTKPTFIADQTLPLSQVVSLELGAVVDVTFDLVTDFAIGDKFYFNGVGPGLLEFDSRLTNTNQYLSFSSILKTAAIGSTGNLSYSATNTYTGTYNAKFRLEVISAGGIIGSRFVNLGWSRYGDTIGASSVLALTEAAPSGSLTAGVTLTASFGAGNFVTGDVFDFDVSAPRRLYGAKDDRVYSFSIGSASNPGTDVGIVTGSYSTGTPEGSFGIWDAEVNQVLGVGAETGYFDLPDGVTLAVRNAMRGNINGTSFAVNDKFSASVTSADVIDWSLTQRTEETRDTSSFRTDVTGAITGTPGTVYIILDNVYMTGTTAVETTPGGVPVSVIEIPNTRFLAFVTTPTSDVLISYEYRGAEPAPGQLYYMSANYLRPSSLYNNPTQVLSVQDGRTFLAPSQTDNHLYIMNELVFENGALGAYYTQPQDADGDGVITDTDVQTALEAHVGLSKVTDLCLLSLFGSLSDSLAINERQNDPFEKKEQMLWVGAPIGTPVGDVDTPNSLIDLALGALQTTPTSPALGTRVLLAPTECTKKVKLDSGIEQTLTLDGSFVAGATSALVNSFSDPATTILRRNLSGFETMQTYSEPEQLQLGQASITFLSDQGSSVFRFEEDITVHTNAEEFQLINATTQKQFVTRVVRREMDNSLIAIVVPSAQAGIALIRSTLSGILSGLQGRGLIAAYQDDAGNTRDLDPNADIVVTRDTQSLTLYYFGYAWWLRTQLKRLFGQYVVNTNDLSI